MAVLGPGHGIDPAHTERAYQRRWLILLLVGPLYYRLLVSGDPLDPGLAREITDAVLGPASAGRV